MFKSRLTTRSNTIAQTIVVEADSRGTAGNGRMFTKGRLRTVELQAAEALIDGGAAV